MDDFNFWEHRLKLPLRSYNSIIDQQIYSIAKAIIDARKNNTTTSSVELAEKLNLSEEYIELIQYALAGVTYRKENPVSNSWNDTFDQPFTYGTSPRCLFVDSKECAERFLKEFEDYYLKTWEEDINQS